MQIVARVQIGASPVHIYYVNETSTAWSHSDNQGTFFVLTPQSATNITLTTTVPVMSCAWGQHMLSGICKIPDYTEFVALETLFFLDASELNLVMPSTF